MKKLVETIVKPLVDYPEDVKVTQELYNGDKVSINCTS